MASVLADEQQTTRLLNGTGGVSIAAVNSPTATVISGPPDQITTIITTAQHDGIRARIIDVDYASHGPQIDQITADITTALTGITPQATPIAFYSTVTAAPQDTTTLDTTYWIRNLRQPVRFADTI